METYYTFKTHKCFYRYDSSVNKIFQIDKKLFDSISKCTDSKEVAKIPEIIELKQKGFFVNRRKYKMIHLESDTLEYSLNSKLRNMLLQVTQNCNLRCKYCVY